jgi:thioredoxin-related protein
MKKENFLPLIFISVVLAVFAYKSFIVTEDKTSFHVSNIDFAQIKQESIFSGNPIDKPKGNYVLHVFATWCESCYEEHRVFVKHKNVSSNKLIGVVYKEAKEDIFKMLKKEGNPFDEIIILDDTSFVELGLKGYPTTILVSDKGEVLFYHQGYLSKADLVKVLYYS